MRWHRELLLATENAADDPNLSISPENCARWAAMTEHVEATDLAG